MPHGDSEVGDCETDKSIARWAAAGWRRPFESIFKKIKKFKKTVDISLSIVYNAQCTDEVHKTTEKLSALSSVGRAVDS